MRKTILLCLLALLPSPILAQQLTRPEAQRVIGNYADFRTTVKIVTDDASFGRAEAAGIWVSGGAGWQPSAKASPYFAGIVLFTVTLRQPLHREVSQITGISDGDTPGTKAVEFTWHFTDLMQPIALNTGVTTGDHKGTAVLRRYDDGWRVMRQELGTEHDGGNPRPFASDPTKPLFRYLGTFESPANASDRAQIEFYRNGNAQVVGRLLYPLMEADSPHCPLGGTYDPATGKVVARCARRWDDSFENGKSQTTFVIYTFTGTWRPGRLTGELTEKVGDKPAAVHHLVLDRRRDVDSYGEKITSLEEWERQ